jgi:hypothetical protein
MFGSANALSCPASGGLATDLLLGRTGCLRQASPEYRSHATLPGSRPLRSLCVQRQGRFGCCAQRPCYWLADRTARHIWNICQWRASGTLSHVRLAMPIRRTRNAGGLPRPGIVCAEFTRQRIAPPVVSSSPPSFPIPISFVAVGTALSGGPPHRSQRAGLPHWAPTLGSDVQVVSRILGMRMADTG